MKRNLTTYLILSLLLMAGKDSLAQDAVPTALYESQVELHQLLKNGRLYGHHYPTANGNQYLMNQRIWEGSLTYDGVVYQDLQLVYDVYNDYLVVVLFIESQQPFVILHPNKIESFELPIGNFIYVKDSTVSNLPEGIYQQISPNVLVKRQKRLIKEYDNVTRKQFYFESADRYYVLHQDRAWLIRKKKDLEPLVGENPEWKPFMRANKLRFRKRSEYFQSDMAKLGAFLGKIGLTKF